jgi:hypothetical protein
MLQLLEKARQVAVSGGLWILSAVLIGMALYYDYPETLLKSRNPFTTGDKATALPWR